MTISSQIRKAGPYAGNGVAESFAFTFKVFAAEDVRVLRTDSQGQEAALVLGSDYSVTLNPDQNAAPGGQVVLPAALAVGLKLTVIGSLPISQPLNLSNSGGFYPKTINEALDRQAINAQQNAEQIARALKFQASDDAASVGELPQKAQRAGRVLAFDASTGKPVVGPFVADIGGGGAVGPIVMADITDKQGKVLDDPVIVSDGDIDSLMTPGGYLLDSNPANGVLAGCAVLVSAVDGYTLQQLLAPIFGVIKMRYHDGAAWQPFVNSVTELSVQQWYSDTTTDAPNAVINPDGTFSRSIATYNPNPLLVVSGASHAFVKADVNKYARYTDAGAKTATFDSGAGFAAGDAFHITNRAASGDITISGTGVTFNAQKNGTLVLEPGDTVTVKFISISPTEADVMGSTGAA